MIRLKRKYYVKHNFLAVSGKLRHGKDTLANLIIEEFLLAEGRRTQGNPSKNAPTVAKIAFADPIKQVAEIIFPMLTKTDLWGPSENRNRVIEGYINPVTGKPLIVRDILTQIGAWGRSTNPDCWVNAALSYGQRLIDHDGCSLVVFSDCRFRNEKVKVEQHGGRIVRIVRPSVGATTNDVSEIDLDGVTDFDMIVTNNDTMESLRAAAKKIVEELIYS